MHLDAAHRLALRALAEGAARAGLTTVKWNASGTCERPVYREIRVRPGAKQSFPTDNRDKRIVVKDGTQAPITIELDVMCRKCDDCRNRRRALWTARARTECQVAQRNWFGTMTLRPHAHLQCEIKAIRRLRKGGTRWEDLSDQEKFRERHTEVSREITLWLKRLRKNTGAKLRVLCVAEAHQSGLPHYHCLVHEVAGTCTHKALSSSWKLGFVKFNLMNPGEYRAVMYATKYLAKSALARIRASSHYGLSHMWLGSDKNNGSVRITPSGIGRQTVTKTTPETGPELTQVLQ